MAPTLYNKGVVRPLNPKVKKEDLDNYVAVHYILEILRHKLSKEKPNIHDRIFMLKSETGTGKSTAFIVEAFRSLYKRDYTAFSGDQKDQVQSFNDKLDADMSVYDFPDDEYTKANRKKGFAPINKTRKLIQCTQPKVLTATSKAKEIATEPYNPDLELGEDVGYSTGRFKAPIPSNNNGIMYSTLGSFAGTMKLHTAEDIMKKYSIVMIDECHIRSVDLDITLVLIRDFLRSNAGNPACPLFIFMSATFDVPKYSNFMGTPETNSVLVVGTEARYEIKHFPNVSLNYIEDTVKLVIEIHENGKDDPDEEADILIFVPGRSQGDKILHGLEEYDKKGELILYRLDGATINKGGDAVAKVEVLPLKEVRKLEKKPNAKRRITVSTNVAETGLTIKALKYVIDCGFDKTTYYSPVHHIPQLITKNVVQSAVEQRLGRVGRNFYGYAFTMYPEEIYAKLPKYEYPDIYTNDASKTIIDTMYSKVSSAFINNPLEYKKFVSFSKSCLDPDGVQPGPANGNCNNIYLNTMIQNSKVVSSELDGIVLDNHPVEMLDNLPLDLYVYCRNKLISLGLYGTFAGYLVSRMPKISIEGARMLITSMGYGVSIGDAAFMAIAGKYDTIDGPLTLDRYKAKEYGVPEFSMVKVINEMIPEATLKKYFFGSANNFLEVLKDNFIEYLIIFKYILSLIRSVTKTDVAKYKQKYKIEKKGKNITPSTLTVVNQKCLKMGIMFENFKNILGDRIEIMKTTDELGLIDHHPSLNLHADDVIDQIARLKRCIYSGFKNNYVYVNKKGERVTSTGIKINKVDINSYTSNRMLYGSIGVKEKFGTINYETKISVTSSLEGWL